MDMIGKILGGRYEIIEKIGEGGIQSKMPSFKPLCCS